MDFINNLLVPFLGGSIFMTLVFFMLLRSDSFVTWLVETVTEILIKKMSKKKQNDFTNYLGVFFINMGIKFINELEDEDIVEEMNQIEEQYNKIKDTFIQKEIVSQEDINYIENLKIEKKDEKEKENKEE